MARIPGANVVFLGNLLYPEGLAETKRFQHFIDGVLAGEGNSARILLLRQSHPGRDEARLAGEHGGVPYRTIGHDIGMNIRLPLALLRYLYGGCAYLWRSRRWGSRNVLFLYGEPSLESFLFVAWARLLGYRVVVDIVEDTYLVTATSSPASRLKAWSVAWATAHMHWFADGVVVISSYLREKLEGIVAGRVPVQLIPISVDLDRVAESAGGFHRPVRLLYAGSFGDKDGVLNLIAAFDEVAGQWPGIEFVMTGRGSPERMAAIRQRMAQSRFAGRIRYLGYLADDEYFRLISDCDIPCVVRVPGEFADRGFPFKLGEYLATGRPVVASRVSDVEVYLEDRVNAMLVEPGSVPGIVAAISYLLADEGRALALGRAGRRVAVEHFSARNNGRRLLELIDRLEPA
ncbi:MAG: glycosyltransferase [Chromatiales bacterium]|nr:glycosyltransferase [Chromatiales bacterium]